MEERTFELDTTSDSTKGIIEVKNYEKTLEIAKEIVESRPSFVILDDESWRGAKEFRAKLNKVIKQIDRRRIDTIEDYTQAFKEQCNEIKKIFSDKEEEIGNDIKIYEAKRKAVNSDLKVKRFTATLKFTDEKVLKKLNDFAIKNNCELTIK